MLYNDTLETIDNSQSTNSAKTLKIFNVYSSLGKNVFFVRRSLKRWQKSTNSENYNFYMFALLEIVRIYKALKRSADLQGPICYNDA